MKQLKWMILAGMMLHSPVWAKELKPNVLDANKLERPAKVCPEPVTHPYHLYGTVGIAMSYDILPTFKYGSGNGNNSQFDYEPNMWGAAPTFAIGWRAENNPIFPGLYGKRAKYELKYTGVTASDSSSLDGNSITVTPINGGSSSTVNFSNPPEVTSEYTSHRVQLLLKSNPGNYRTFVGLDFNTIDVEHEIDEIQSNAGDPFSLDEEVNTWRLGPTAGVSYHYALNKSFKLNGGARSSIYYFDSDLDAKQKLAGSTNNESVTDSGADFVIGAFGSAMYHFTYGHFGLFGQLEDNPVHPHVNNPDASNEKVKIEEDNAIMSLIGFKFTIHGKDYSEKPKGRCVGL